MPDAKYFSVLDASSGFWQVYLISTKLCTFNTPFSRHMFKRLPFGISSAHDVFQVIMSDLPLTSAKAKRSYSSLQRLKNLCSTMTQNRLNHLILLHVHKRAYEMLDIQKIAAKFVNRNERGVFSVTIKNFILEGSVSHINCVLASSLTSQLICSQITNFGNF